MTRDENKYFDYNKLLNELKMEEKFFGPVRKLKEQYSPKKLRSGFEPLKSHVPLKIEQERKNWSEVVTFMRENPKMFMKMLDNKQKLSKPKK